MNLEPLRELERKWRDELPYKGSAWEERHDILNDCADDLSRALAQLDDGWRPIAEAPADADWWLVWSELLGRPIVVTQRMDNGTYWDDDWGYDVFASKFHQLPSPPAQVKP